MLGDLLTVTSSDRAHVRFVDGVVFHATSGEVTDSGDDCHCAGTTDDAVFRPTVYREAVPQLQLSLTDACNMGCTYCSFRDRVHADGKPVTLPMPVVRRGIELYRSEAADTARYGRIDFGLAGETMLVRHLHDEVHRLIEDGLDESPLSIVWSGPNVTNGTLSMSPDLAATLGPPQDISLDGPREVHDRVRFYTNGRGGTYDDVRSVLDQVLRRHPTMGVSAVLTAYSTDFAAIFRHLYEDVGARNIYMKPVNAVHAAEYALNPTTLPAFQEGYLGLVEHILDHDPQGVLDRLLALSPEDYFMRFVYRVKDRAVQIYRCGAGKSGAYVDTNGNLYACAHFIGKSGWHIGHVDTGFDEDKRRAFAELTVDTREPCRSCFARYVCGGGCHYQAVLANGDIAEPDAVKCELIRFLTRLAVRLVTTLREHHPDILAALPAPYGIDPAMASSPPETVYRPLGRLVPAAAPAPLDLTGPGHLRGGLPEGRPVLLHTNLRGTSLTLDVEALGGGTLRVWFQPYGDDRFTMADLPVRTAYNSGRLLRVDEEGAAWLDTPSERFRRIPHPELTWLPAPEVAVERRGHALRVSIETAGMRGTAPELGINVFADLTPGGTAYLAVFEPFVSLSESGGSPLALTGPDADGRPELLPLGRWAGLRPNVC